MQLHTTPLNWQAAGFPKQKSQDEAAAEAAAEASAAAAARLQDEEKQRVLGFEREKAQRQFGAPSYGFDRRRGLTSLLGVG